MTTTEESRVCSHSPGTAQGIRAIVLASSLVRTSLITRQTPDRKESWL